MFVAVRLKSTRFMEARFLFYINSLLSKYTMQDYIYTCGVFLSQLTQWPGIRNEKKYLLSLPVCISKTYKNVLIFETIIGAYRTYPAAWM